MALFGRRRLFFLCLILLLQTKGLLTLSDPTCNEPQVIAITKGQKVSVVYWLGQNTASSAVDSQAEQNDADFTSTTEFIVSEDMSSGDETTTMTAQHTDSGGTVANEESTVTSQYVSDVVNATAVEGRDSKAADTTEEHVDTEPPSRDENTESSTTDEVIESTTAIMHSAAEESSSEDILTSTERRNRSCDALCDLEDSSVTVNQVVSTLVPQVDEEEESSISSLTTEQEGLLNSTDASNKTSRSFVYSVAQWSRSHRQSPVHYVSVIHAPDGVLPVHSLNRIPTKGRHSSIRKRGAEKNGTSCKWLFKSDPGVPLLLTFKAFSTPNSTDCRDHYIAVEREGNGFQSRWCGVSGERPGHASFARSQITLYLESSGDGTFPTGFSVEVQALDVKLLRKYAEVRRIIKSM